MQLVGHAAYTSSSRRMLPEPEPYRNPAQGQLATYKEVAAGAEAERERLEAEVVATAQLVTAVEARLRGALQSKNAAEARVGAAEMRVREVAGCFLDDITLFIACV